jgi:type IV pilus assembly protein PilA
MTRKHPRGFTLIELMIVVAIIGILSSIAGPLFMNAKFRARTTERPTVARAIASAIGELFRQDGRVSATGALVGAPNPPLPAVAQARNIDWNQAGWAALRSKVSIVVEGSVYYSYEFQAWDAPPAGMWVRAVGDLDADGVPSPKLWLFERREDSFILVSETPAAGQEDFESF